MDGREYFFKTKEQFEQMIEDGELIEHACYVGNYYGTPKSYVMEQLEAGKNVKEEGKENNLLELIAADPAFNLTLEELERSMDPAKYVGRAPLQVTKFLENVVHPALAERKELLGVEVEITV